MIYLSALTIVLGLYIINVSLLPHILISLSQIVLVLPFISLYSLRDKSIFPYILAVFAGLLYDGATVSAFPIFAVTFLLIVLAGKNIFSKITSYGVERTSLLLTVIGFFAIILSDWERLLTSYTNINLYLAVGTSFVVIIFIHFILFRVLQRYFDFVEKTTSERFR